MANFQDSLRAGGLVKGPLQVASRTASEIPLDVQGVAGQTANLVRLRNSAGSTVFSVDNDGTVTLTGSGIISIDQTITGNLTVNGNTTLGNAASDTLSVVATSTFSNPVTINSTETLSGIFSTSNLLRFTANTTGLTAENWEIGRDVNGNLQNNVPLTQQHIFSTGGVATMTVASTQVAINSTLIVGGHFTANGGSTLMGQTAFANGTAALPSITFASDLDTGIYKSTTDTIGFTANASSIGTWSPSSLAVIQAAQTSGVPTAFTVTTGAHTTLANSNLSDVTFDFGLIKQFNGAVGPTTITNTYGLVLLSSTYRTAGAGALTITNAPTFYVSGAPSTAVGGGGTTITNPYAIWSDSGLNRFDGGILQGTLTAMLAATDAFNAQGAQNSYAIRIKNTQNTGSSDIIAMNDGSVTTGIVAYGSTYSVAALAGQSEYGGSGSIFLRSNSAVASGGTGTINLVTGGYNNAATPQFQMSGAGNLTLAALAGTSGTPTVFTLTGPAHTSVTAATEIIDVNVNLARNITWAAGAGPLATQRSFLIQAPTYVGNVGGALTITDAYTAYITGAPIAGANMTLTRAHTLGVNGTFTLLTSGVQQFSMSGDANSAVLFRNRLSDDTHIAFTIDKTVTTANAGNKLIAFASNGNVHTYMRADNGQWVFGGAGSASDTLTIGNGSLAGILDFTSTVNANQNLFTQFKLKSGMTMTLSDTGTATPKGYYFTDAAFTALTASTEFTSFNVANSSTITFATGDFNTQRSVRFQQPTFASVGGVAMTITHGINVSMSGAPSAGAGVTITNPAAAWITGVTSQRTSASMELSNLKVGSLTATLLNQIQVTSACGIANARFLATTVAQSGGAVTVDTVANVYIDGTLTAGGSVTLTNNYSLFVDAGAVRFDDHLQWGAGTAVTAGNYSVGRDADATNQLHFNVPTGATMEWSVNDVAEMIFSATNLTPGGNDGNALGSATVSWSDLFLASGGVVNWANGDYTITHATSALTLAPVVATSGSPVALTLTGAAHITLAGDTEASDVNINLARTVQFTTAGGTFLTQRAFRIQAPTYGASAATETIINAVTLQVDGAPQVGTNMAITNSMAFRVGQFNTTGLSKTFGIKIEATGIAASVGNVTDLIGIAWTGGIAATSLGDQTANLTNIYGASFDSVSYQSTTNTRTVTGTAATVYIAGAPTASTNVSFSNLAYSLFVDAGASRFDGAIIGNQGTDIASASTIVIPTDGNVFELTGTTAVNLITKTNYQDGHMIVLIANENVTINHGTATSGSNITILLAGAGNYAMTANDTLTLVLSTTTAGGQAWREVARTAI